MKNQSIIPSMNKFFVLCALFAALGLAGVLPNCGGKGGSKSATSSVSPSGLPVIPVKVANSAGGAFDLSAEVASTAEQQATGLMSRESLGANEAMLFTYTDERTRAFWMKDTLIPLDMLFVDAEKKIVDINRNATPESTAPYFSKAPAQYVLEVNGGWCAAKNVQVGDSLAFSGW